MNSNLIDLTMVVHFTTERAAKVSDTGEDEDAVWLPLSEIQITNGQKGMATITLPEWLAVQKGLV